MADELDELGNPIINPVEERIKTLSSKVKTTAEERDAANAKVQTETEARMKVEKERDFYATFTESAAKYPGSLAFRDQIKEKVIAGYSVEDATVSVLNKEGKLTPEIKTVEVAPAAGGSAVNQLPDGGQKTLREMTRDEKRAALIEEERKGNISLA